MTTTESGTAAAATPNRVRLLQLNLWGIRGDWAARRTTLVDGLGSLAPDLVTLQEAIVSDGIDQASQIVSDGWHVVHQRGREPDGQGVTTLSRWPVARTIELPLEVTVRTTGFACTALITEIQAPDPFGRIWLANYLPDWQLDHEHERQLQAVALAGELERLRRRADGHVIVAGDLDADPLSASVRFWTGRQALEGTSTCYRDAWESANPGQPGDTFVPHNPFSADWDWPFRRIDYILVRCGEHGGPTLSIDRCFRVFDRPDTVVSDHYGLVAEFALPPEDPG